MAIKGTLKKTVDLDVGVQATHLGMLYATSDHNGQSFEITLKASQKDYDVTGAGVVGYFIRNDDYTVMITGSAAGNVVKLTLPESCYVVPGHFSLIIKVTSGSDRKAIFWGDGCVTLSSTDAIIDPGHEIPSLEELLAQIAAIESATKAAQDGASKANSAATSANNAADYIKNVTVAATKIAAGGTPTVVK